MKPVVLLFLPLNLFLRVTCSSILNKNGKVLNNEEKNEEETHAAVRLSKSQDILTLVGEFMPTPVASMQRYFDFFNTHGLLKFYVSSRFNIPELEDPEINANEIELHGLFNLSWSQNNKFALFGSLMEDLASGKKPFKVLFRPLVSFLARTFTELSEERQLEYKKYLQKRFKLSFEVHLGQVCAVNGHFDLAFDFLRSNLMKLVECFYLIIDRQSLIEFFKTRPDLALEYQRALPVTGIHQNMENPGIWEHRFVFKWIANCIVYNSPENFYTEILAVRPIALKYLGENLLLTPIVPESENIRIHDQIRTLFVVYLRPHVFSSDFKYFNLLNDIRFSSLTLQSIDLSDYFSRNQVYDLAKAALFGNKNDIFFHIYRKYGKDYEILSEIKMIIMCNSNFAKYPKYFKVVFELYAKNAEKPDFDVMAKFYALKHLHFEGKKVVFEFVALEDLLAMGFPPVISIEYDVENHRIYNKLECVFSYLNVFSEETAISLADDFQKSPKTRRINSAPMGLIELLTKSSKLLDKFVETGIKVNLHPSPENIRKFFELENHENVTKVIDYSFFDFDRIVQLPKKDQIRIIETIDRKSVADYYFSFESSRRIENQEITESEYFQWRLAFSYWIKGDKKEKIRKITSQNIIKMLRLEFFDEMNEILGPEKI